MKEVMSKQLQLKLFGSVIQLMTTIGVSEADIRGAFESAIAKSEAKRPKKGTGNAADAKYQPNGDVSAHLLRMWFRDVRLVKGVDSKPRPLPLSRGKSSLKALIEKLDDSADATAVIRDMKAVGLIKRNARGLYVPTASAAVIPRLHPWVIEHAVRSVVRFVSTIHRNSNPTPGLPPLLERYSYVPDLNPADSRGFAEFARDQGLAYLNTLDDWLEHRRVPKRRGSARSPKSGVPAGVHLITFLGGESTASMGQPESNAGNAPRSLRRRRQSSDPSTHPPSTPS